MAIASTARIHPTAHVDPAATIGERVEVGPFVLIEGEAVIGDDCVIRSHSSIIGPLVMGKRNDIGRCTVLGERPQHTVLTGTQTRVVIGDDNVLREQCTIHRGTDPDGETRLGHGNYFMVGTHVGHDSVIGDKNVFANNTCIAGHCVVEDRVFISGNSGVHQFSRVGRLSLLGACSSSTKDMLPFIMIRQFNEVVGVNTVGMRRAGMPTEQIMAVRKAFHILYRSKLPIFAALARMEKTDGQHPGDPRDDRVRAGEQARHPRPEPRDARRRGRGGVSVTARIALGLWVALCVGVTGRLILSKSNKNSVVPIYLRASQDWIDGRDPYRVVIESDSFRYPPVVAAWFAPWTLLPPLIAEIGWRALGVGLTLAGLRRFRRDFLPGLSPSRVGVYYSLAALLALPSVNNGQANPHVLGLMLLSGSFALRGRSSFSSLALAMATALKIYPAALAMLFALALPWRCPLFLVVGDRDHVGRARVPGL